MASIFTPAFHQAATTDRGVELFKCTGIVPWNLDIFTDADFLASDDTEREDPEEKCEPTPAIISSVQTVNVHGETVEIDPPEPGPSNSQPVNLLPPKTITAPAPVFKKPSAVLEARSCLQISSAPLGDLIPLPKSTQKRSSNRKHKKSEVISGSPYKRQLEDENEQKNKTKSEPRPKKVKNVTKPKTNNNRKIWRCGGCNEVYKEPIVED